ncbi:hypothetical protein [Desulfocicer vacuolatum]|nr:hypothetical protein [Desulfocicer vacuolatum]
MKYSANQRCISSFVVGGTGSEYGPLRRFIGNSRGRAHIFTSGAHNNM